MPRTFGLGLALVLAAVACTTRAGASDPAYVAEARAIMVRAHSDIAALRNTLELQHETSQDLFTALTDLRLAPRMAILVDRAARLEPPPDLEADHEVITAFLDRVLLDAEAVDRAIAESDTSVSSLAVIDLEVAAVETALAVTAAICPAVTPHGQEQLCDPTNGADDYLRSVSGVFRRLAAEHARLVSIPLAAGPFEDTLDLQAETTLRILDLLDGTVAALSALTPPPERVDDHAALLDHVSFVRLAAERAQTGAVEGVPAAPEAYPKRLGSLICLTRDQLSADGIAAAATWFERGPTFCDLRR